MDDSTFCTSKKKKKECSNIQKYIFTENKRNKNGIHYVQKNTVKDIFRNKIEVGINCNTR